jgi:hypothetical protein
MNRDSSDSDDLSSDDIQVSKLQHSAVKLSGVGALMVMSSDSEGEEHQDQSVQMAKTDLILMAILTFLRTVT